MALEAAVPEAPLEKSALVGSYGYDPPVGSDDLIEKFDETRLPPWGDTILVGELHHRLQNTLSVVLALSRLTARTVKTLDEFQVAFGKRIEAMARTNALLLRGQVQAVSVQAALEAELRPYLDDNGQVTLNCDPLEVFSDVALSLSLIFHELATNAVKYGALSASSGRLVVECRRGSVGGVLQWREFVTSPIAPATREGSGSLLIARLTRALGGTSTINLPPEGLQAEISFRCGDGV
jgi:two-component system CheB/CheR fusion protein